MRALLALLGGEALLLGGLAMHGLSAVMVGVGVQGIAFGLLYEARS